MQGLTGRHGVGGMGVRVGGLGKTGATMVMPRGHGLGTGRA